MKSLVNKINCITIVILVFVSISGFAVDDLSGQLKSFNNKFDPGVEKLLIYYADNNQYLNSLEMQQAAYIASKVDEWEIAGFYYIARPMIAGLILKSIDYNKSTGFIETKRLYKYWGQLDERLKPLKSNKLFKGVEKLKTVSLEDVNPVIRLKLINNIPILEKSLALYIKWRPNVGKNYHHVPRFNIVKSQYEINSIFNQLNEIYIEANQDFIKLLGIPRYKELKLKYYEDLKSFTKTVDSGKFDLNKFIGLDMKNLDTKDLARIKRMMEPINRKREMEQIEIDNLLFPEIAWGSWY